MNIFPNFKVERRLSQNLAKLVCHANIRSWGEFDRKEYLRKAKVKFSTPAHFYFTMK